MNKIALESFITYCDDMMIAEEGAGYKFMRKSQTSVISLKNQLKQQKKELEHKYAVAADSGDMKAFKSLVEKRKAGIQRKINGKEINDGIFAKKKKILQDFITLYDSYLSKC